MNCTCGRPAERVAVNSINVAGFTRPPVDQREIRIGEFQEAGAELEYQASRQTDIEGKPLPTPSLWKAAKQQAKHLQSLGVNDSLDVRK